MNDTKWKKKNVEPEIKTFSQDESNIPIIEGFDEDIAKEIKRRAEEYLQKTA